jgi:DNA-binding response OmpR family regulator
MRLLLVEDEKQLAEALAQILEKNNYIVDTAFDGEKGLEMALSGVYDIAILDIMLPKVNGLDILKEIRSNKMTMHILMLTAKAEITDKVKGLDYGADDYLAKPFSHHELLARLRSISRRKGEIIKDNVIEFSDIKLDLATYEFKCNENTIRLGLKEFEILKYFLCRPKIVVANDDIITKLWGYDADIEHNNIEVYISFLRKKLSHLGSRVSIKTIRGIGYKLEE